MYMHKDMLTYIRTVIQHVHTCMQTNRSCTVHIAIATVTLFRLSAVKVNVCVGGGGGGSCEGSADGACLLLNPTLC